MSKIGKRIKAARANVERTKLYKIDEAVKLVKGAASAKFDESVEIAMNLGVDPKHADQMVRGVVNLPNGTGRSVRVAVFARGAKADEAKAAGADVVGAEELVNVVQGGTIDFDRCIATPDMMGLVGKASFGEDKLVENIKAFVEAVARAKPTGAKGTYIQRVAISSTMGPGVKVDVGSVGANQAV